MSDLEQKFQKAKDDSVQMKNKPDNDKLLKMYAKYKQATEGDNQRSKPGFMDFVGTAKWEAWEKEKGKDKEQIMQEYVDLIEELKAEDK